MTQEVAKAINDCNKRINEMSQKLDYYYNMRVNDITPTTYVSKAYIGDSEVVFDNVVGGNVSVYAETENGKIISTITDRIDKSIRVSFETLEEVATVTISIL